MDRDLRDAAGAAARRTAAWAREALAKRVQARDDRARPARSARTGTEPVRAPSGNVHRMEIDGIPTFWVDRPGPITASLAFRVGMADETLPTLGISHLVEHLALFPQTKASCSFNGRTEDTRTLFYATGTAEEITDFLGGVCRALNDLPLERMETEKRVLQTEANSRGNSFIAQALSLRFGPSGHGLPAYPEHGLRTITADQVAAWTAQRFTRGNATLAITGRPPKDLDLRLHNGHRYPTPRAVPVDVDYPTVTVGFKGGIGVAMLAERSSALTSLVRIIQRRAMQHLRTDLGLSYGVDTSYQRLDDDIAHLSLIADALPEHTEAVLSGLLDVLEDLARDGTTADELERDLAEASRAYTSDDAVLGELAAAARYELFGEDPKTQDQLLAELREVRPQQQAAILRDALDTSLWVIPPGTAHPDWRFQPFSEWSAARVVGRRLRRRSGAGPRQDSLTIAPEGVSLSRGDKAITVRFAECEAMLCWDSGERVLYGNDGFVLDLTPGDWRGGEQILEVLDGHVDHSKRVPMGEARPSGESRSRAQLGEPEPRRRWPLRRRPKGQEGS